jgi:RNA polymerase sigma-70 factor (ECF subfamily)
MAAAQEGDAGAYESLLISLLPVLRSFVRRRGVDGNEVEDVVQEVLLLIHRARHTWRPDRPFDPWMWAIARNAARTRCGVRSRPLRRHETSSPRGDLVATGLQGGDPGPNSCSRRSSLIATGRGTGGAPPATQAVEWVGVEQLVADAAARAGVTTTVLKVRAHRFSGVARGARAEEE